MRRPTPDCCSGLPLPASLRRSVPTSFSGSSSFAPFLSIIPVLLERSRSAPSKMAPRPTRWSDLSVESKTAFARQRMPWFTRRRIACAPRRQQKPGKPALRPVTRSQTKSALPPSNQSPGILECPTRRSGAIARRASCRLRNARASSSALAPISRGCGGQSVKLHGTLNPSDSQRQSVLRA